MTRFALIPFALIAVACADSTDLDSATDEVPDELREYLDDEPETARRVQGGLTPAERMVRAAERRYGKQLSKAGCDFVGVGYGIWTQQNRVFTGAMLDASGDLIDKIQGRVDVSGQRHGTVSAKGANAVAGVSNLHVDGDYRRGMLEADVMAKEGADSLDLVMVGNIRGVHSTRGHIFGALAICD